MQPVAKTGLNRLGQEFSMKKEPEEMPPITATDGSLRASDTGVNKIGRED
jgi:hypothetical protein